MELTTLPEWNLDEFIDVLQNGADYDQIDSYSLYAIIDVDYNDVKERFQESSIAEVCHAIRTDFRKDFFEYYQKTKNEAANHDTLQNHIDYIKNHAELVNQSEYIPINNYSDLYVILPDHKILILWSNLPEIPYLTDLNNNLLYEFCKRRKKEDEFLTSLPNIYNLLHPVQIYISSFETLAQGSPDIFLQRLSIIHRFAGNFPEFMSGENIFCSFTENDLERAELHPPKNLETSLSSLNVQLRKYTMASFDMLMSALRIRIDEDALNNDFITNYFAWQRKEKTDTGTVTVDRCCHELSHLQANKGGKVGSKTKDRLSTSVFYGIVAAFETSPIYAEYLYVFKEFRNIERIGLTDVDEFLELYAKTITTEFDMNQRYQLCQMTGCVSLEALHRLHLAVYKKSRSRRRKENAKKEH